MEGNFEYGSSTHDRQADAVKEPMQQTMARAVAVRPKAISTMVSIEITVFRISLVAYCGWGSWLTDSVTLTLQGRRKAAPHAHREK